MKVAARLKNGNCSRALMALSALQAEICEEALSLVCKANYGGV
jgi:hypothetical protein